GVRCEWLAPPIRGRRANLSFVLTFPTGHQEVAPEATSKPPTRSRPIERLQDDQEVAPGHVKKSLVHVASPAKTNTSTRNGLKRTERKKEGEDSPPIPPDDIEADFAKLWSTWPVKVAEDDALAAYTEAVKDGADRAAIQSGAERYAAW